jgi:hypothetical protein
MMADLAVAIAQHTPGPWRVGADLRAVCVGWTDANGNASPAGFVRGGWPKVIAKIPHGSWAGIGEHVANARLIATAPELLRVLELMNAEYRWSSAGAAISMARGGAA